MLNDFQPIGIVFEENFLCEFDKGSVGVGYEGVIAIRTTDEIQKKGK